MIDLDELGFEPRSQPCKECARPLHHSSSSHPSHCCLCWIHDTGQLSVLMNLTRLSRLGFPFLRLRWLLALWFRRLLALMVQRLCTSHRMSVRPTTFREWDSGRLPSHRCSPP